MVGVGQVALVKGILGISEGYRKEPEGTKNTQNVRDVETQDTQLTKAKCIKCYIGGDMVSCSPPPLVAYTLVALSEHPYDIGDSHKGGHKIVEG
ncbi:hypothetical protein L3X38_017037 [Prunus dulcis]|uniref:Uncharacterized protein n=1 Tax=Prunus dulcis TaxID=3755 RepID=A0AAD4W725_PRUDU|nr:hypothetical protein L3X38_017037 [Prunus dulcis]